MNVEKAIRNLELRGFGVKHFASAQEAASFYQAEVFKDMTELRLAVDEMETLPSRACWPYPSYGDLLFSVR
mgnify:CR=1 FL=1